MFKKKIDASDKKYTLEPTERETCWKVPAPDPRLSCEERSERARELEDENNRRLISEARIAANKARDLVWNAPDSAPYAAVVEMGNRFRSIQYAFERSNETVWHKYRCD